MQCGDRRKTRESGDFGDLALGPRVDDGPASVLEKSQYEDGTSGSTV